MSIISTRSRFIHNVGYALGVCPSPFFTYPGLPGSGFTWNWLLRRVIFHAYRQYYNLHFKIQYSCYSYHVCYVMVELQIWVIIDGEKRWYHSYIDLEFPLHKARTKLRFCSCCWWQGTQFSYSAWLRNIKVSLPISLP